MGIFSLTLSHLKSAPSTTLAALQNSARQEVGSLKGGLSEVTSKMGKLSGEGSIAMPEGGRVVSKGIQSPASVAGTFKKSSLPVATTVAAFSAKLALGDNPSDSGDAQGFVTNLQDFLQVHGSDADKLVSAGEEIAALQSQAGELKADVIKYQTLIDLIDEVLNNRALGVDEEPVITTTGLSEGLQSQYEDFIIKNVVRPFKENLSKFEKLIGEIQTSEEGEPEDLFDLVYGPPVSVKGQFVLSEDGLYYDSRVGGLDASAVIPQVTGNIAAASSWDFEFAPNLGGKGVIYGRDFLNEVEGTIFSDDFIEDSETVLKFYSTDDVLETLKASKSLHVEAVSSHMNDLIVSGYSSTGAVVQNMVHNIAAVATAYEDKVRKRKKQLQLVALFGMDIYGFSTDNGEVTDVGLGAGILLKKSTSSEGVVSWVPIDRVPINDFSFLKGKGIDVSLDSQMDLVLFSADLEDTTLPLTPKFLVTPAQPLSVVDKFSISPTPVTEFPYFNTDTNVSSTNPLITRLDNAIVTKGLILGYNFLQPSVLPASSNEFNLDNFAPDSNFTLNGQLVASSIDHAFPSGLSIPFLRGCYWSPTGLRESATQPVGVGGSYVRLPSTNMPNGDANPFSARLDDLTYKTNLENLDASSLGLGGGFAFDLWTHVPDLTMQDNHRYRVLLANENSGRSHVIDALNEDRTNNANRVNLKTKKTDQDKTHGLIVGFRDKGGISTPSGLEFFISPTVSQNREDDATNKNSICFAQNYSGIGNLIGIPGAVFPASAGSDYEVVVPSGTLTSTGVSLTDASSSFLHICASVDYTQNTISIYFDGLLVTTSNLSTSLGLDVSGFGESLFIPNATRIGTKAFSSSWSPPPNIGPRTGAGTAGVTFTPWILGGGFSDTGASGFLGTNTNVGYEAESRKQHSPALNASSRSGLDGYIGSFKMYLKPLSKEEALQNFEAQKGYFKNIKL